MKLDLNVLPEKLAIVQFPHNEKAPKWISGNFYSITQTAEELSIVCNQNIVPEGIKADKNWKALKVIGPLEFSLVGILANLSTILAKSNISIFTISTYDTDYILVKKIDLEKAIKALKSAGHNINNY